MEVAILLPRSTIHQQKMLMLINTSANEQHMHWPMQRKKRGYMVCTGNYVATNTRKQRRDWPMPGMDPTVNAGTDQHVSKRAALANAMAWTKK
jgi:hypothetical protein